MNQTVLVDKFDTEDREYLLSAYPNLRLLKAEIPLVVTKEDAFLVARTECAVAWGCPASETYVANYIGHPSFWSVVVTWEPTPPTVTPWYSNG